MKKILIAGNNMIIGGIEKSLISFLKTIDYSKYNVTLLLQEKKGELLNEIPKSVNIFEYKISNDKNVIIRKIKNRLNYIKFIIKNRFDIGICYTSYVELPSRIIRYTSKKTYMWIHLDYTLVYNKVEFNNFIKKMGYSKYDALVFVSNNSLNNYINSVNTKQKCILCPNILEKEEIIMLSSLDVEYEKKEFTFLNVSRHEEISKKLSRLLEACEMLRNDNYKFKLIMIGNGEDTVYYKEIIEERNLNNYVLMLGSIKNPFPYYKIADCFVLSSDYEGGPLTVYESLILKTPVITTDVGDVRKYMSLNDGIIVEKSSVDIYNAMKKMIDNNNYNVIFNCDEFNRNSYIQINEILGDHDEV